MVIGTEMVSPFESVVVVASTCPKISNVIDVLGVNPNAWIVRSVPAVPLVCDANTLVIAKSPVKNVVSAIMPDGISKKKQLVKDESQTSIPRKIGPGGGKFVASRVKVVDANPPAGRLREVVGGN